MAVVIGTCGECNGTAQVPNPGYPGTYGCSYCNGTGVMRKRGYGGYKNATTAGRALETGHGMRCNECDGTGRRAYPQFNHCYRCDDGQVVIEAHADDTLPEGIDRGHYVPKPVAEVLARELTYTVVTEDRPGSWAEMHLGIGSVVSVTDYGDAWRDMQRDREATEVRLIEKAREELRSTQWAKLVRREDRRIANRLVISVHHNGYNLFTAATVKDAGAQLAALPPTYTASVLNRPVSS